MSGTPTPPQAAGLVLTRSGRHKGQEAPARNGAGRGGRGAVWIGVDRTKQGQPGTFDAAVAVLGYRGTTEFTTVMGYFRLVGLNANAGDIDLPVDRTETDLPV